MTTISYEIRQCPACGLRYPLTTGHPFGERCPACLGETQVMLKRDIPQLPVGKQVADKGKHRISALLDNIRSAWNVGSIFRTADGLGVEKLHLCGITPTPENESVAKTSLGAEETVKWEYARNALETANRLKNEGCKLIALEQDARAIFLSDFLPEWSDQPGTQSKGLVLILGNEVTGVDPALLDLCDQIVHIPMLGSKRSFNVEVAFGIAAFHLSQSGLKSYPE